MDRLKQVACDAIDQASGQLHDLSDRIWQLKELGFEEHQSHATLTQFLSERGFSVEEHFHLETAFAARWENHGSPCHPHVAMICEYDALPELGHACGHNLIAEIGVGAGLGVMAAMKEAELPLGKLSIIGTPAEEGGGGKIDLIKAGAFDDVDVAMMSHPAPFSDARPIFLGGKRFVANFHGRASHAAGYPWEGVNALDAAVLGYVNVSALRQQMRPNWRVHAIIPKGGTRTNIIPDEAQLSLQVRAPVDAQVDELATRVKACITAAAAASGCTVDLVDGTKPYGALVTNETLARLYEANGGLVGVTFPPAGSPKRILGSTDMGNVSSVVPSIHPTYRCETDAINHTHEFCAAAGSQAAQASTLSQAKALAMVALDVLQKPDLMAQVKADFLEKGKVTD